MSESMQFLDLHKVKEMTSLRESTIRHLMREDDFPASVPLSPGRKGWVRSEVEDWMKKRLEAARSTEGRIGVA